MALLESLSYLSFSFLGIVMILISTSLVVLATLIGNLFGITAA